MATREILQGKSTGSFKILQRPEPLRWRAKEFAEIGLLNVQVAAVISALRSGKETIPTWGMSRRIGSHALGRTQPKSSGGSWKNFAIDFHISRNIFHECKRTQ